MDKQALIALVRERLSPWDWWLEFSDYAMNIRRNPIYWRYRDSFRYKPDQNAILHQALVAKIKYEELVNG